MDNLNELGKNLNKVREDTDVALRRDYRKIPSLEKSRDLFDSKIPFEMYFKVPNLPATISMSISFILPISTESTCCCGGCVCAQCDVFIGAGTSLATTYSRVASTIHVYQDDVETTNFTEPDVDTVELGFDPLETTIKVCYVYLIEGCT